MSVIWHADGTLEVDDVPPPPGYEPPPRHSADDYKAIAERLKVLGYRKWITG